jgi:hypothetical protein
MIHQHDISRQLERARRLLKEGDSTHAEVTRRGASDRSRHLDRTVVRRPGPRNADAVTYAAKAQDLTPTDSQTHRALADEPDRLEALDTMRRATTWISPDGQERRRQRPAQLGRVQHAPRWR